jgi:hypothetical protein
MLVVLVPSFKYRSFIRPLVSTTVTHFITGPAHASWSLETSLFTTLVRHAGNNRPAPEEGVERDPVKAIQAFRKVAAVEKFMPVPKNGFTVDQSIPVVKRGLGGILTELDNLEDGTRSIEVCRVYDMGGTVLMGDLQAEWVVHNDLMAPEAKISPKVILYFHGVRPSLLLRCVDRYSY